MYPVKDSLYLFVKEDNEIDYICGYQDGDGKEPTAAQDHNNENVQDRGVCNTTEVSIMVLYTPAVANIPFVDLSQYIDGLIAQANNVIHNSNIYTTQLHFSLAFQGVLSGFTETSNIATDLTTLSTSAAALRATKAADCVVLLTAGDYNDQLGSTFKCGPGAGLSFSIAQFGAASSRMTFTHELGHQFGCKHGFGNNNGSCEPTFQQPFEFKRGLRRLNTIMETGIKKKQRIPNFSNPEAIYHGHATGQHAVVGGVAETNNARQLREQAATVAAFNNPITPSVTIDGTGYLCTRAGFNHTGTFTANICGWTAGTYTLAWQISINNGTSFGSAISTSSTLVLNATNFSNGDLIFIRLTLTPSTGTPVFAFDQTLVDPCGHEGHDGLVAPGDGNVGLQLAPNPAMDYVSASLQLSETSPVTATLLDGFGHRIRVLEQSTWEAGEINFTWHIGDLPTGIYQIQTATNRSRTVQKLAIFH